ncbi:MAG TPA: NAD(P)-dependent oxidoreductase [Aggregatilineales bacterium]|nr:NAD(P)-dependent oxidoreductase [Aggregatilineales bacterium]
MILIIGGLGFVGANTAEALLHLGEDCVLTRHHNDYVPAFLKQHIGKRIFIEGLDISSLEALRALGQKYRITGIVHLATGGLPIGPGADALELVNDVQATLTSIAAIFQVAHEWNVKRVSLASAPVVYNGITDLPWRDDQPLAMTAAFSMEVAKKCGELVASYLALQTHVESVEMRLSAMYGPNYNATRSSLVGRLVHAAVKGEWPNLEELRFGSVHTLDGGDQCYIKDAARAVALLQTADKLSQPVYNVASGRPTSNQEIVAAIKKVVPDFDVELPAGHAPGATQGPWYFDISSLRQDTGFEPRYDLSAGVAEYVAWLRAGNER